MRYILYILFQSSHLENLSQFLFMISEMLLDHNLISMLYQDMLVKCHFNISRILLSLCFHDWLPNKQIKQLLRHHEIRTEQIAFLQYCDQYTCAACRLGHIQAPVHTVFPAPSIWGQLDDFFIQYVLAASCFIPRLSCCRHEILWNLLSVQTGIANRSNWKTQE